MAASNISPKRTSCRTGRGQIRRRRLASSSRNLSLLLLLPQALLILLLSDIPTSVMAQLDHIVKEPYSCIQNGCSDQGFCREDTDTCECQPEYRGDACEIKIELCPDGDTTCYNHGTCTPDGNALTEGGKQRYRCVCPERFGIPLFRGQHCEIKTFTSCETISQQSDEIHESFCVNGGTCTSTFDVNNANQNQHTACDCSTAQVAGLDVDLWGEYCEVLDVRASRSSGPDREVATAFIVVVIIIFVCSAIVFVVMGFKRGQRESTDVVQQHHHTDSMGPTIAELEQSDNGEFT